MSRRSHLTAWRAAVAVAITAVGLTGVASGSVALGAPAAVAHPQATGHGTKVSLHHTSSGRVLVGPNGHALYDFTSDTKRHSHCGTLCRQGWPPLMTHGKPRAGKHVKARLLGQTSTHQVTYRGHPLYYYAGDSAAGQVNGEGNFAYGGYWYLVNRKGHSVKPAAVQSPYGYVAR